MRPFIKISPRIEKRARKKPPPLRYFNGMTAAKKRLEFETALFNAR